MTYMPAHGRNDQGSVLANPTFPLIQGFLKLCQHASMLAKELSRCTCARPRPHSGVDAFAITGSITGASPAMRYPRGTMGAQVPVSSALHSLRSLLRPKNKFVLAFTGCFNAVSAVFSACFDAARSGVCVPCRALSTQDFCGKGLRFPQNLNQIPGLRSGTPEDISFALTDRQIRVLYRCRERCEKWPSDHGIDHGLTIKGGPSRALLKHVLTFETSGGMPNATPQEKPILTG
jgi:hypothetical protein